MKKYEKPMMQVYLSDDSDVLTTSQGYTGDPFDDGWVDELIKPN